MWGKKYLFILEFISFNSRRGQLIQPGSILIIFFLILKIYQFLNVDLVQNTEFYSYII